MSANGYMTMRAVVERNTASGQDTLGQDVKPTYEAHNTFACWVWSKIRREVVAEDKTVEVEDIRGMVALGTDISENTDRIARIEDRRGTVLFAGPLKILAIITHPRHLELTLERFA